MISSSTPHHTFLKNEHIKKWNITGSHEYTIIIIEFREHMPTKKEWRTTENCPQIAWFSQLLCILSLDNQVEEGKLDITRWLLYCKTGTTVGLLMSICYKQNSL